MNILLTGSNGFLGSILYTVLSKSNKIFTLATKNAHYEYNLFSSTPVFNFSFDLVIHCAGKAHVVPRNKNEEKMFFDINVTGTKNLLKSLSLNSPPKKFVFISSVSVYGLTEGENITESTSLLAVDPYGKSKIEAEQLIIDWCENNDVICTILRLPLIVGSNPPGNLGSMIKAINKGYYFNIANGLARKSMVLAEDVANVMLNVAEIGGIYNLTDGFHPTFSEFSTFISSQLHKKKPMNIPFWVAKILAKLGDLFGDNAPLNTIKLKKITTNLIFNDSKARKAFNWNPNPVIHQFKNTSNV